MGSPGIMLKRGFRARKEKRKGAQYISFTRLPRQVPKMTKEMAMKVLGLTKAKTRDKVAK